MKSLFDGQDVKLPKQETSVSVSSQSDESRSKEEFEEERELKLPFVHWKARRKSRSSAQGSRERTSYAKTVGVLVVVAFILYVLLLALGIRFG